MRDIDERGMRAVMEEAIKRATAGTAGIHVSFDLDGMDPDYAPGVGTPSPGGLSYREAHLAMEMLADTGKVISAEFVEVNPVLDHRNGTAKLGGGAAGVAPGQEDPLAGQHRLDLVHGPVELLAGDHERRGEADRVHVGVLAEQAAVLERVAVLARAAGLGLELDAGPQADAADLLRRAASCMAREARLEVDAQLGRALDQLLVDQHVEGGDRRPRRRAGCRRRSSRGCRA